MSAAALFTLVLLIGAAAAFAAGRWRPDAVALLALLALLVSGTVSLNTGLAGFGSPALIAMAAVFVLSAGLERTGVATRLGRRVLALAGPSELRLTVAFVLTAGLLSGVMNSIGAMAVLLPAAIAAAREARISPSRLLLPLALGTRLGGNLTLISGPSNLIASDALVQHGLPPFGFFEFLPVGGTFLLAGLAFIALVGRKWLPDAPLHETPRPENLAHVHAARQRTELAPWALFSVALLIAASTAGVSIAVATLLAAGLVVISGCVTMEEIYQAVDWRALVFMGAILPLGMALSDTGAAASLSDAVLRALGASKLAALAVMLAIAIGLNQVMPSVAATAVLAPLAIHAAAGVSANPHAYVMAVIAGTGTTFTPISNPVNLLVMGPGGYQMKDYVRIGLPLAVLLGLVSILLIPVVWPL